MIISLLVIFSTNLCHVFECGKAVYGMGVFMSGAGPHFPNSPCDIVRIHTLMIYSDIFEYNVVVDSSAALRTKGQFKSVRIGQE